MVTYCIYCGRPLQEGEVCSCRFNASPATPDSNYDANTFTPNDSADQINTQGFKKYLSRLGFGDDTTYGKGAYEKGSSIVPDCLDLSDEEKPIKQYTVAKMNNRILGIPIEWALGKLQITNKRLIFRGPGTGIAGRTCLNYEFSIDEIAGVTVNRRFVFQPWALFVSILSSAVGFAVFALLFTALFLRGNASTGLIIFCSLFFGLGGLVPFFLVRKKWFLKLMAEGATLAAFYITLMSGRASRAFFIILLVIVALIWIFTIIRGSMRPDLVLLLQGKTAVPAIQVNRRTFRDRGVFGSGYTEILPVGDVEECVRELNAIITDIQKLGDYAVEKWKVDPDKKPAS